MSSSRIKKNEPCAYENCRSKRFRLGDDGYTYCDNGHQQHERGTVIAEDTGEFVQVGRTSRKRDSDSDSSAKRPSGFSGAEALEHCLLCLQLVLRKQLRWLIEVQKMPEELEVLVKDLWALRLQKLQGRISYESESDTEAASSQFFSSESESESQSASQASRRNRRGTQKLKEGTPNLLGVLSLCYTGILFLRSPVTAADMLGWVNDGVLLYYRAGREVPFNLKERLPPQYQHLLEPQELIKPEMFHECILETLSFFSNDFGMAVPSINIPLVVYRWMRDLALPIEVFAGTQRLASLLELEIEFDLAKTSTRTLLRYPEVQLMALMVVVPKLLFPMDARAFKTQAAIDLSAVQFDWRAWAALHEGRKEDADAQEKLTYAQAFDFTESDCLASSEEQLDAYLDWCEDMVASEDIREHGRAGKDAVFRRTLFDMFPIRGKRPADIGVTPAGSASSAIGKLSVQPRLTDEDAPRGTPKVGEFYRRFRTVEDLSGPAKVLFEEAARSACLSLEGMVQAVFLVERRLQRVGERLRKGFKSGDP